MKEEIKNKFISDRIDIVKKMCEQFGYGFVMNVASKLWQEIDKDGSFVIGPCKVFTVPCKHKVSHKCKKCHGSGWVYKCK